MSQDELSIKDLLGSLKTSQIWKVIGAIFGLLVGAFVFGVFIQETRSDRDILEKDTEISSLKLELRQKDVETENVVSIKDAEIATLKTTVEAGAEVLQTLDIKSRFLSQYVTYLRGKTEASKNVFVDLVCAMWRNDQKQRVEFFNQPFSLSASQIVSGNLNADVRKVLIDAGVPFELASRIIRIDPVSTTRIGRQQVVKERERLERQFNSSIRGASLMKVVSFSEAERYILPDEVAATVHLREDCKP